MRVWKKIIALSVIVFAVAIALFVHSRRISRIDFIQQHLANASKTRFFSETSGGSTLPAEFLIFEDLQKIRAIGYEPIWKDYRYILRGPASGEEIDPFLWKGNWSKWVESQRKGDELTRWLDYEHDNYDVLYPADTSGLGIYDYTLYNLKLFGADWITMKDNRFIIAEKSDGSMMARRSCMTTDLSCRKRGSGFFYR